MENENAMFAMGCFWSPELLFSKLKGVVKTRVGFAGGKESYKKLSYTKVCLGNTGHAEVVKIWYDTKKISYEKLLNFFWKNHDPAQGNRQGQDSGSQYRSMIFYFDETQKNLAEKSKENLQLKLNKKITTEIFKASKFYEAKEYHQRYLEKNGQASCHI